MPLENANTIQLNAVKEKVIPSFSDYLWNTRVNRIKDLVRVYENQSDKSLELGILNHASHILERVMCLLNLVELDSFNWQDLSLKLEHEGRRAANAGFKEHLAIIMEHIPYLENAVSNAISIINGNIDFSEIKNNKAMNWAKGFLQKSAITWKGTTWGW